MAASNNHILELIPVVADISMAASTHAAGLSLMAADLTLSSERLAVLVQGDNDSDASEDDEPAIPLGFVSHTLLGDIADDLSNDTQCLLDLGARFEEQVMNPIASEAAANPLNSFDSGLSDTFIERIIRLYPRCESNLAGRIGKANCLRFLRMAESKPRTSEGRVIQDRDTEIIHEGTESEPIDLKSIVDIASTREKSLFHDSGLGTASHVSGSHPNAVRTAPETQGCPPLPEGAVQGEPFRCMACKNQVTMANEKEWRYVSFSKTFWSVAVLTSRIGHTCCLILNPMCAPSLIATGLWFLRVRRNGKNMWTAVTHNPRSGVIPDAVYAEQLPVTGRWLYDIWSIIWKLSPLLLYHEVPGSKLTKFQSTILTKIMRARLLVLNKNTRSDRGRLEQDVVRASESTRLIAHGFDVVQLMTDAFRLRRVKCDNKVKPSSPREQSFSSSTLP
jgi:hypothetical protein